MKLRHVRCTYGESADGVRRFVVGEEVEHPFGQNEELADPLLALGARSLAVPQ